MTFREAVSISGLFASRLGLARGASLYAHDRRKSRGDDHWGTDLREESPEDRAELRRRVEVVLAGIGGLESDQRIRDLRVWANTFFGGA